MKKITKNVIIFIVALFLLGVYYYVTIPAINIHSAGFWMVLMALILFITILYTVTQFRKQMKSGVVQKKSLRKAYKEYF